MKITMMVLAFWLTFAPAVVWSKPVQDKQEASSSWLPSWKRARDVFLERMDRNPLSVDPWSIMGQVFMSGMRAINESLFGPILISLKH